MVSGTIVAIRRLAVCIYIFLRTGRTRMYFREVRCCCYFVNITVMPLQSVPLCSLGVGKPPHRLTPIITVILPSIMLRLMSHTEFLSRHMVTQLYRRTKSQV